MTERDRDELVAECLEDYHRRRAKGEEPSAEDYRERAGDAFVDFVDVLAAESALDDAVEPDGTVFPHPFGEYTLLRELGRGAMGVVYEAMHRDLGRKVALKVLRTGFDVEASALERFRREARACAQVRHDHIVEIYDAGEVGGRPYYSMALLEGRSLHEVGRDEGPPDARELCASLVGVADALDTLHEAGIVHRDVKPSNIMVEPSGRMVLADFGLARAVDARRLTATGQALGTPLYMSPEQVLGKSKEIDGRADVYGLGATFYEVLVGGPVFDTQDMATTLRAILHDRPALPRSVRPDIPEDVEQVIMKSLEKRKEDRYQTAGALRDDLLAASRGEPVSGRPVSPAVHALRKARKFWPLAAAAVITVTAGVWYANTRPGILTIACYPRAQIWIDDEEVGETTIERELPPGEHKVVLKQGGFGEDTFTVTLEPGEKASIQRMLLAEDADDPETLKKLAEEFEIAVQVFEEHSGLRASDDIPCYATFPRGRVTLGGLATYRIDVTVDFQPGGRLVFRRSGEVVHEEAFDPENMKTVAKLPAKVLDGLRVGDKVSWGYELPEDQGTKADKAARTASFTVVGRPKVFAALHRALSKHDAKQPAVAVKHLETQILLNGKLYLDAYREAARMAEADPESERAWAVMQAALIQMDLKGSPPWNDAFEGLLGVPKAKRGRNVKPIR